MSQVSVEQAGYTITLDVTRPKSDAPLAKLADQAINFSRSMKPVYIKSKVKVLGRK
jgi:hypothetical protein